MKKKERKNRFWTLGSYALALKAHVLNRAWVLLEISIVICFLKARNCYVVGILVTLPR